MFCHHDDEDEVFGADPVPCPLCGMGGPEQASSEIDPLGSDGPQDSNQVLRAAFAQADGSETSALSLYW